MSNRPFCKQFADFVRGWLNCSASAKSQRSRQTLAPWRHRLRPEVVVWRSSPATPSAGLLKRTVSAASTRSGHFEERSPTQTRKSPHYPTPLRVACSTWPCYHTRPSISRYQRGRRQKVSSSERRKEINRRRHRRKKMTQLKRRVEKANVSEKRVIASKIRSLTPGAEKIIASLELEERYG